MGGRQGGPGPRQGGGQGAPGGGGAPQGGLPGPGGAGGGLLGGTSVSGALTALLEKDASDYTWVAATTGSNEAASYQLATGDSVMPIGGFNGSDPSPTLAQFKKYVAEGKIHYYIAGSVGQSNGGSDVASKIASWVEATYTARTVGGVTVYDLSTQASSSATAS
jgi:hypothetical protein